MLINHLPHNFFLDSFFGFMTAIGFMGLIWLMIALVLNLYYRKGMKNLFKELILAEIFYFFLVELLLKNLSARLRPQFILPRTILPFDLLQGKPFDLSQSFSFPSGHATIAFAGAYILGKTHRKFAFFYYLLALLISFSRIYLGKHYPGDVVAGAILGLLIGYLSSLGHLSRYEKS